MNSLLPMWLTWKAKANFITCIWYLARTKKITDIFASKSEWMTEIPTENIACDYEDCNSTLNRISKCVGLQKCYFFGKNGQSK